MSPACRRGVGCFVHCFAIWGCLLLVGREGRRGSGKKWEKKQTKTNKNKKPRKICIPVGKADADVKGC
jgi:hypothetical protein